MYKDVSMILMNLVVLFVVVNILGFVGLQVRDLLKAYGGAAVPGNPWADRAKVYPGLDGKQIYHLFMESWEWREYGYAPFSQLAEQPYTGEYVNVTAAKFRKGKTKAPWPPPKDATTVFVFGGSTTFGYGLPDWQTVPSFLSESLRRKSGGTVLVYNFGRAFFYSTHEMLEFLRLISDSHRLDVAIFIDGLNEFYYHEDKLIWTKRLSRLTEQTNPSAWRLVLAFGRKLPAYEFGTFLIRYLGRGGKSKVQQAEENIRKIASGGGPETANRIIDRYLRNKAMIEALGRHSGTTTLFVWQPVPTYKYDLKSHLFSHLIPDRHTRTGGSYDIARARYDKGDFGGNVAWCADIQEGLKKPFYVDSVHYSAELSRLFADCILDKTNLMDIVSTSK
jgi:lysophospholipase L1-like esterase